MAPKKKTTKTDWDSVFLKIGPRGQVAFQGTEKEYKELAKLWYEDYGDSAGFTKAFGFFFKKAQFRDDKGNLKRRREAHKMSKDKKTGEIKLYNYEAGQRDLARRNEGILNQTHRGGDWEGVNLKSGAFKIKDLEKGYDRHHINMINMYQPFFKGLPDEQQKMLTRWAFNNGYYLGNHPANLVDLMKKQGGLNFHGAMHQWMREHFIQVSNESFPNLENLELPDRWRALLLFLNYNQEAVNEKLEEIKREQGDYEGMREAFPDPDSPQRKIFQELFGNQLKRTALTAGSTIVGGLIPGKEGVEGLTMSVYDLYRGDFKAAAMSAAYGITGEIGSIVPVVAPITEPLAKGIRTGREIYLVGNEINNVVQRALNPSDAVEFNPNANLDQPIQPPLEESLQENVTFDMNRTENQLKYFQPELNQF